MCANINLSIIFGMIYFYICVGCSTQGSKQNVDVIVVVVDNKCSWKLDVVAFSCLYGLTWNAVDVTKIQG